MSREAWGDHDPNDELCAVPGCGCKALAFGDTCEEHRHCFECDTCAEWVVRSALIYSWDDLGRLAECATCYAHVNYSGGEG